MKKNIIYTIIAFCISSQAAFSQAAPTPTHEDYESMFNICWDVNVPVGNDFIKNESWAGGKLEFRKFVSQHLSVGAEFAWNSYFEYRNTSTYHFNASTDVTTDLYTYNYVLPMALNVHYYFPNANSRFIPYMGLAAGATYTNPSIYFNIYQLEAENWGFLIRPELGTVIKFDPSSNMGLLLGARYAYSTNKEDSFRLKSWQAVGFQLGLVWLN